MKELVFYARNGVLKEAGEEILPGVPFTVSDERAEELLTDLSIDVREIVRGGLKALSREELNELAAEHGVSDPEALPNKQAVIDQIEGRESESASGPEQEESHE